VAVMPDGRLLVVWWAGPFEGSLDQVILGANSADGGRTWSAARSMANLTGVKHLSQWDPALISGKDATWLFFALGRLNPYPAVGGSMPGMRVINQEDYGVGTNAFRVYVQKSADSGSSWSRAAPAVPQPCICRNNGIVLRNGAMLLPVYFLTSQVSVVGPPVDSRFFASVLRSDDQGVTWKRLGRVQGLQGIAGDEPTIAELDDGSVLMTMRSSDGHAWFSQSHDGGATWTEAKPSEFEAAKSSHALYRTRAGRILFAYNACSTYLRSPLVLRVLNQKDMTWSQPVKLAEMLPPATDDKVWFRQVCYPSITELSDGTALVVWTEIKYSELEQTGRIRSARVRGIN